MKPDTPKTTRKNLLACLALAALAASLPAAEEKPVVSLRSLLDEQIDRDALARFPDTDFTVRQFSSANPKSVAPDQPGWFANGDSSHFLREDNSRGRREWVLLDHAGPGAIVRFWVTVASTDGKGILRVYLDGSETPVIEGGVLKVLSGGKLAPPPLSASVSPLREYLRRGHNLYLPVPYAKHCLVTYESPTVRPKTKLPAGQRAESFFYNIEVRQYPENTRVETFSNDVLRDAAGAIARNNAALKAGLSGVDVSALEKIPLDGLLPPGGSKSWKITGAKAVRLLSLKIAGAETAPQKLRSTVLEILFDGRASVWSPVGDFFGTGFKYSPAQTWFTAIRPGGLMQAAWVMPFRESCEIRLRNLGEETVDVSGQAAVSDWNWGGNDMLFGAGWHELNRVRTRLNNDHFDVNYATLEGEGVLVGTGVSLFNTADRWWGEGDEKIFIEGAPKPTHIGTGSEDYYGYAWSCGLFFEHPFIAQPDGAGAGTTGHVVNTRVRALDKLPFHRRLQFDMELWHWADTVMNYAPNAQWYMKPGGLSNRGPEPEAAAVKLPKNRRDLIPLKLSTPGRIESDTLEAAVKGAGTLDTQKGEKYSGGRQLIWR
ncbi:MAG: DUF2961 domain-containing protein, partial [Opitutaceae bacterium]|nr:DUF2961 domain-containing protein [Opitutaceae bacterium]